MRAGDMGDRRKRDMYTKGYLFALVAMPCTSIAFSKKVFIRK